VSMNTKGILQVEIDKGIYSMKNQRAKRVLAHLKSGSIEF
jgi:hypothetical protein